MNWQPIKTLTPDQDGEFLAYDSKIGLVLLQFCDGTLITPWDGDDYAGEHRLTHWAIVEAPTP